VTLLDVRPLWPYRLPASGGPDGVSRVLGGVYERLLCVDGAPIVVRAWEERRDQIVRIAAVPAAPWMPVGAQSEELGLEASQEKLEIAAARVRHALGVDDDYREFFAAFRGDRLLAPAFHRLAHVRVRRTPWPWEALAWAVTEQLIEETRARQIQRRIVRGRAAFVELPPDRRRLWDVPDADAFAAMAPAELAAFDLAPKRALAMIRIAREVALGRCDLDDPGDDRRLLAIPDIGPWTVQVLRLKGRGEADSLPAGDLAYIKLVGVLAGLGRRATVAEVEEFFAPYAPFRGLAGLFSLIAYSHRVREAGPQRLAPDAWPDAA